MREALVLGAALLVAGCAAFGGTDAATARAEEVRAAEVRAAEARIAEARAAEVRAAEARAAAAVTLLQHAETQTAAAQYRSALALYDEFLQQHPDDVAAPRVRATRTVVERLVVAQTEIERLRRDADVRQAEIDRLKASLERLRRIDMRPSSP